MACKRWKKTIALVLVLVLAVIWAPAVPKTASAEPAADPAAGTAEGGTAGDAAAEEEEQAPAAGKIKESDWITKDDYKLVTENDSYKMYLYEKRLSVMLENKKTGKIIETTLSDEKDDGTSNKQFVSYMKSGIVIYAIMNNQNTYQVDMNSTPNTTTYTMTDKGFSVKIFFEQYQFGLTMNVELDGEELIVTIPDDSIVENKEGTYISTIAPFPFMNYSYLGEEEGYMLIPDGNGALINLDNKEGRYNTGFSQMVYGKDAGFPESDTKSYLWEEIDMQEDANSIIAPVFGMAHTKEGTGFFAIVEKGEKRAEIVADPNGANNLNYNRCFARFKVRDIYNQLVSTDGSTVPSTEANRSHSDLQVRYMLLSGDEANYSAMAVKYRDYLLKNKLIEKKDAAFKSRVDFLGTDREKFLLGTRAVTMTTTEDIENIYKELQSAGVSSLLSVYKGWQKGGLYDLPITKYKADGHIGGTSRLTDLIKNAASSNYNIYLYNDAMRLNPKTNLYSFNTIKEVTKQTMEEEIWAEVYRTFEYLTPNKSASNLQGLIKSAAAKDIHNLALAGISNTIFSYNFQGKYYTRMDTADSYANACAGADADTNFVMEQPSAYLWKNTDAFLDMPLGSSKYLYVDEEIPFVSMVLKGIIPMYSNYINFEANKQEFLLQMAEAGVFPSFYITQKNSSALIYTNSSDLYSTEYTTYKDAIVQYDKELRELNDKLGDANIVKHESMDNGVNVVTYSNGVKVYVNYSDSDQEVDGITVGAMSYKAGEAE